MIAGPPQSWEIPTDAVHWDSGDWIDWYRRQGTAEPGEIAPEVDPDARVRLAYRALLQTAKLYHEATGRHLPVYEALAELHGVVAHGLSLDRDRQDTTLRIACIAPYAEPRLLRIDFAQEFDRLLAVSIAPDFGIESRLIERHQLHGCIKGVARLKWSELPQPDTGTG
ncbi:hypothetical protein R5H30_05745 [Sulfitobacter sp. D35]|uniref:hypothetical protein n=1 Tax=Sulfitobacter sp. D35 TaxID=3083252 RepID=UPI00296F5536|nr:hypothetical protein [Sulfitobacter sp. D35]MDW4497476.1 hypothetical protein [Sulfitobacter sp. D35]